MAVFCIAFKYQIGFVSQADNLPTIIRKLGRTVRPWCLKTFNHKLKTFSKVFQRYCLANNHLAFFFLKEIKYRIETKRERLKSEMR